MGSIKYMENDSQTYSFMNLFYLKSKQHHTCFLKESFLPSTPKLCNDLPDFIKISRTLSSFKKHLKEFFSKTLNGLYHFGAARTCK